MATRTECCNWEDYERQPSAVGTARLCADLPRPLKLHPYNFTYILILILDVSTITYW